MVSQKRISRHLQPGACLHERSEPFGIDLEELVPLWVGYDRRHTLSMEPRDELGRVGRVQFFLPREFEKGEGVAVAQVAVQTTLEIAAIRSGVCNLHL